MEQFNLTADSSFKTAPKWSMTSLSKDERKFLGPGPGSYKMVRSDSDKFKRTASWSMGASGRDCKAAGIGMPGPASYKPEVDKITPKWVFSKENRIKMPKPSAWPGPGEYKTEPGFDGRQFSLSGRCGDKSKPASSPGPGEYKPSFASSSMHESAPKASFGTSSRQATITSKTPGPGKYNHECFKNAKRSSQMVSLKSRHEVSLSDASPGPCAPHTQFK